MRHPHSLRGIDAKVHDVRSVIDMLPQFKPSPELAAELAAELTLAQVTEVVFTRPQARELSFPLDFAS